MVSILTFKTNTFDPKTWVHSTIQGFQRVCASVDIISEGEKNQVDLVRKMQKLPATYLTYSALIHCKNPPPSPNGDIVVKKNEVLWLKAIKGFQYSHMVERQWHGDEITPGTILASPETRANWQSWMDDVSIASAQPTFPKPQQ
jgi:hypothetical protein